MSAQLIDRFIDVYGIFGGYEYHNFLTDGYPKEELPDMDTTKLRVTNRSQLGYKLAEVAIDDLKNLAAAHGDISQAQSILDSHGIKLYLVSYMEIYELETAMKLVEAYYLAQRVYLNACITLVLSKTLPDTYGKALLEEVVDPTMRLQAFDVYGVDGHATLDLSDAAIEELYSYETAIRDVAKPVTDTTE